VEPGIRRERVLPPSFAADAEISAEHILAAQMTARPMIRYRVRDLHGDAHGHDAGAVPDLTGPLPQTHCRQTSRSRFTSIRIPTSVRVRVHVFIVEVVKQMTRQGRRKLRQEGFQYARHLD
jgi:hypothetical protein